MKSNEFQLIPGFSNLHVYVNGRSFYFYICCLVLTIIKLYKTVRHSEPSQISKIELHAKNS